MNQKLQDIRKACIKANPEIVERDFRPKEDYPFRCVFTEEAIETGYKPREGDVIGETRNKEQYRVRWAGIKSVYTYYKGYIEPSVELFPTIHLGHKVH